MRNSIRYRQGKNDDSRGKYGGFRGIVAVGVCDCLGIKNSRDALSRLDDDEKGIALIDTFATTKGKNN